MLWVLAGLVFAALVFLLAWTMLMVRRGTTELNKQLRDKIIDEACGAIASQGDTAVIMAIKVLLETPLSKEQLQNLAEWTQAKYESVGAPQ